LLGGGFGGTWRDMTMTGEEIVRMEGEWRARGWRFGW